MHLVKRLAEVRVVFEEGTINLRTPFFCYEVAADGWWVEVL